MLFVTTGTYGFTDLVRAVDEIAIEGKIHNRVVAQIGNSRYVPKAIKYFRTEPDIERYIIESDYVISHGGTGCIVECLLMEKKVIGVPNGELSDNHQYDYLKYLGKERYLIFCESPSKEKIMRAMNEIELFEPVKFNFFPMKLYDAIRKALE